MAGNFSAADTAHMRAALALAARGLGQVWPNPSVGCVLVRDGVLVGRGWTRRGGRPHGETEALAAAGPLAGGATAYVSLEPCNHHGKTPPCTEAVLTAGVGRVVVACEDPDPRVSGRGIQRLRDAGIPVEVVRTPFAELYDEIMIGFVTGRNRYDVILIPPAWIGDFAPYLAPVPERLIGSATFTDIHAIYRDSLMRWQDRWVALTIVAAIYIGVVAPFATAVHEEFYLVAVWLPPLMILLLGLGIAWLAWFVTAPRRRKDRSGPAT